MTMEKSASTPLDINHLCPLITQWSPSRTAIVSSERGSNPRLWGWVIERPDSMVPSIRGPSHRSFWSPVPYLTRIDRLPEFCPTTPKSAAAPIA